MKVDDIVLITHKEFNCNGRILAINGSSVELYVSSKEMVYKLDLEDIESASKKSQFIPKSRKDLYMFIHKKNIKSKDIFNLLDFLAKSNKISYSKKFSKSSFEETINTGDKYKIVEMIRTLRDQGLIKFNLPNNSHNPRTKEVDDQIQEGKKYNY